MGRVEKAAQPRPACATLAADFHCFRASEREMKAPYRIMVDNVIGNGYSSAIVFARLKVLNHQNLLVNGVFRSELSQQRTGVNVFRCGRVWRHNESSRVFN